MDERVYLYYSNRFTGTSSFFRRDKKTKPNPKFYLQLVWWQNIPISVCNNIDESKRYMHCTFFSNENIMFINSSDQPSNS